MSAVAISANPILNAVFFAPPHNWNLVIFIQNQLRLRINPSLVILPSISRVNATCNGSSSIDLSFHSRSALYQSILQYFPNRVSLDSCTATPAAFVTYLFVRAKKLRWIFGSIGLATFFRKTHLFAVHVYVPWVSSIAATTAVFAIDDHLGSDRNIRPRAFPSDIDPVCHHAGCSLDPAGPAIVRRSLIFSPGQVIHPWNVAPVPIFRNIVWIEVFMWPWTYDVLGNQLRRISSTFLLSLPHLLSLG